MHAAVTLASLEMAFPASTSMNASLPSIIVTHTPRVRTPLAPSLALAVSGMLELGRCHSAPMLTSVLWTVTIATTTPLVQILKAPFCASVIRGIQGRVCLA